MNNEKSIQAAIDFLKKNLNNPALCRHLKEIKESVGKIKPIKDSDHQSDESDSDEEKNTKKYSLRNANKSLTKHESSEGEDTEDEELEAHLKTLDTKARINFLKKLASISAKFEWIDSNVLTCSIDDLWKVCLFNCNQILDNNTFFSKYLTKQVGKAYFYGLANEAVFDRTVKIIKRYSQETQFLEKLQIIVFKQFLFLFYKFKHFKEKNPGRVHRINFIFSHQISSF